MFARADFDVGSGARLDAAQVGGGALHFLGGAADVGHQSLHVAHGGGQALAGEPRILERCVECAHVVVAEHLIEAVHQLHEMRGQVRAGCSAARRSPRAPNESPG